MTDPYYPQKTNYAIKPAPSKNLQQILSYIQISPHDNLGQAPFQRQPHLAISKSSIDTILQNTQTRGQDIVDIMTQDKLIVLRATAELLKQLIDSRSQIREDNVASLDTKVLQCENYILDLDVFPAFSNSMVEAKRGNLGHSIAKLESEKNGEIAKCWSDQAGLYQELLTTLAEYRAAIRRSQLLSGDTS